MEKKTHKKITSFANNNQRVKKKNCVTKLTYTLIGFIMLLFQSI